MGIFKKGEGSITLHIANTCISYAERNHATGGDSALPKSHKITNMTVSVARHGNLPSEICQGSRRDSQNNMGHWCCLPELKGNKYPTRKDTIGHRSWRNKIGNDLESSFLRI